MEIRWKASFSASCLYATLCRFHGNAGVDLHLAEASEESILQLLAKLDECHFSPQLVLPELVAASSNFENNRQLVEVTLAKVFGAAGMKEVHVSTIEAAIGVLEASMLHARPQLADELAQRGRPLQEQWQARGPGLLQQVKRLTDETLLAPAAEVVLVTPWLGGGGMTHLKTNQVIFEGVLANPHEDLPETLRLGWLLAQLHADVPVYSEAIPADRLPLVANLAALPVILTAAETVEWGSCSEATIARALECWLIPKESPKKTAKLLWQWWQAYQDGSTSWLVAWRGLESLLR